jgi:transcriptional regulator with XRE-family HTH domain
MATISIPALVKSLRERLGLTQEQFAHEVGVTFSTVNQWENGRRRPQPFLLKRLLEIETSLGSDKAGRLKKAEAQAFKKRWETVNAAEREELAATPVVHKFLQLTALLTSARNLGWLDAPAEEEVQVRNRWARLRRVCHA